jgi:hypothetical protein
MEIPKSVTKTQRQIEMDAIAQKARELQASKNRGPLPVIKTGHRSGILFFICNSKVNLGL